MRPKTPLLALALRALPALGAAQDADPGRIVVAGHGEVAAKPDGAHLSIGVVERADSAAEAASAMGAAAQAVIARLQQEGIAPADIRTGLLQLQPRYDYSNEGQGRPDGFEATTVVEVEVDDLDALGPLLDDARAAR